MDIISFLLICVLIALYTFQTLFCKLFSGAYPGGRKFASPVFTVLYGLVIALISLAAAGFSFAPSATTAVFGIINGLVLCSCNFSMVNASVSGPYSLVMISMMFGGILVPMAGNFMFFNGSLNPAQWIAVIFMLAAFVLLNYEKSGGDRRPPVRFYVACALLFLSNGLYGALIDSQQRLSGGEQRSEMIIITYSVSALLALAVLAFSCGGAKKLVSSFRLNLRSAAFLAGSSSAAASALFLLMICLARVNSVVLYTLDNGGVLLVSVIIAFVMFREKLTWTKLSGVALSLISIVMLSIF